MSKAWIPTCPSRLVNYGCLRAKESTTLDGSGLIVGSVRVARSLVGSCGDGSRDESGHADEVVRGGHQICRQLRQLQADEPRSSKATDGLHPSEDLLDSLAFSLADCVTSVTGGALIDGAASTAGVLGDRKSTRLNSS